MTSWRNLTVVLAGALACLATAVMPAWAAGQGDNAFAPPAAVTQNATPTTTTASAPALDLPRDRPQGNRPFLTEDSASTRDLLARMLAAMVVIVLLGVLAIIVIKRVLPRISRIRPGGKRISVLETAYLGPRQSVHLVQVGGRKLLIASSKDHISMLADVTSGFEQVLEGKQA